MIQMPPDRVQGGSPARPLSPINGYPASSPLPLLPPSPLSPLAHAYININPLKLFTIMKTGAWLRGGRGKIAGMVAQKSSDGKGTVLRELVIPKNPQSIDQMATRLAFGTVTQAAALMLPIIGQTFKGQSDEKLNRRRFVSLNVPVLKAEAVSQSNGGDVSGLFRGKNTKSLIPNNYIISEGSLALPARITPVYNPEHDAFDSMNLQNFTLVPGTMYKANEVLASMFGILPSQQLTTVGIFSDKIAADAIEYVQESSGDFVRNTYFGAMRIVFNNDAPTITFTAETTIAQIKEWLRQGFDATKTSESAINTIVTYFDLENNVLINGSDILNFILDVFRRFFSSPNLEAIAFGNILSQLINGAWDYTSSTLVKLEPTGSVSVDNLDWYGLSFIDAVADYLPAGTASKLFTRKGGDLPII